MKARRSSLSALAAIRRLLLLAQFERHLVEGVAEMAEVAFRPARRHLHIEIAGGDLVGRADQPADRRRPADWRRSDPSQTAEITIVSASSTNMMAKPSSILRAMAFEIAV